MGQDKAIARYLDSARVRNCTANTIRRKAREIARFRWWLDDEGVVSSLAAVTEQTARDYRRFLASQPIGAMTWAPTLSTVKQFFAWACNHDLLLIDPFARVDVPRREKTLPPYLTQTEVKAILDATPAEEMLRDRAILELLYSSALRVRELVQLDLTDIDPAGGVLLVRQGKGRKDRIVPIGRIAATLTSRYIGQQRVAAPSQKRVLFVNDDGRRMSDGYVRRHVLAPALTRAAIEKHVTLHVLRHSCAIHLLENGASVRHVQALLGHAKLSTTQKYLNVIPLELKRAHAKSHPSEHQQLPAPVTPMRVAPTRWNKQRKREE